jgi:hypothetical protein
METTPMTHDQVDAAAMTIFLGLAAVSALGFVVIGYLLARRQPWVSDARKVERATIVATDDPRTYLLTKDGPFVLPDRPVPSQRVVDPTRLPIVQRLEDLETERIKLDEQLLASERRRLMAIVSGSSRRIH